MIRKAHFFLLNLFVLLVPVGLCAQATGNTVTNDNIIVSDLAYDEEVGAYYFMVSIEGEKEGQNYCSYNMDITLPNGISLCSDGEDEETAYWAFMSEDRDFYPFTKVGTKVTWHHTFGCNLLNGNMLRVACYSSTNSAFKAKNGVLFMAYVHIDDEVFESSFSPKPFVTVSGIRMADNSGNGYQTYDFTCRPFSTGIPAERTLPLNISATNKLGTLILPFDAILPQGVKAYSCYEAKEESDGNGTLMLAQVPSVQACTPYIVYAPQGYSGTITGTVDYEKEYPDYSDIYTTDYLTGVLGTTVVNSGYIMQNQGEGPMFYNVNGASFSLNAGRCYFTPGNAAMTRIYRLKFDGAASIDDIVEPTDDTDGITYDLMGRRVDNPTKGIYIRNGKKVVVK